MAIPTLKASQVKTLEDACQQTGSFAQVEPVESLDGTLFDAAMEELRDTEQMLILGLIKEITKEQGEKVGKLLCMTGRTYRVFQLTAVGCAMFSTADGKVN